MAGSEWTDKRPKSPHLQIWRWHWTMAASIFHRASGVALYVGAILFALVFAAAASGPESFDTAMTLLLSIPGRLVLLGITAAAMFHLANGIKYLLWDGPKIGFDPKTASNVAMFNIFFAVVATAAIWAAAYFA